MQKIGSAEIHTQIEPETGRDMIILLFPNGWILYLSEFIPNVAIQNFRDTLVKCIAGSAPVPVVSGLKQASD